MRELRNQILVKIKFWADLLGDLINGPQFFVITDLDNFEFFTDRAHSYTYQKFIL